MAQYGNAFLGMDINQVRATAGQMEQAAGQISAVVSRLTSALASTDWRGPDAERFRDAWSNQHAPAIRQASADIRSSAGQVRHHIELQIQTSHRS